MARHDTDYIDYRPLVGPDLHRLGDIDRSERIDAIYLQHGTRLEKREGDFSAPPWISEGEGEHSVAHKRAECERCLEVGGVGVVASAGERLVGIGLIVPH